MNSSEVAMLHDFTSANQLFHARTLTIPAYRRLPILLNTQLHKLILHEHKLGTIDGHCGDRWKRPLKIPMFPS